MDNHDLAPTSTTTSRLSTQVFLQLNNFHLQLPTSVIASTLDTPLAVPSRVLILVSSFLLLQTWAALSDNTDFHREELPLMFGLGIRVTSTNLMEA
jgi:hypothetical protein